MGMLMWPKWGQSMGEVKVFETEHSEAVEKLYLRVMRGEKGEQRPCGFRTFRIIEMALYHSLGKLPEPALTHRFF